MNQLPDRWHTRDLPVLYEVARVLDDGDPLDREVVAAATGLAKKQVDRALVALTQAGYLTEQPWGIVGENPMGFSTMLTERGRRTVGIWPSGDDVDALVDALRQAEDSVTDPKEKTLIRRAAGALTSVSRDVMVDVVAAVVARQSGLG